MAIRKRVPVRALKLARPKRARARKGTAPTPIPSPQGGGEEGVAAPARKTARPPALRRGARKTARKPRNPKPVRAIESRRLQMTPALYDNVRHRYEHTAERLHTMAADLGCSAETVRNIARRDGWVRYRPPPRVLLGRHGFSAPSPCRSFFTSP